MQPAGHSRRDRMAPTLPIGRPPFLGRPVPPSFVVGVAAQIAALAEQALARPEQILRPVRFLESVLGGEDRRGLEQDARHVDERQGLERARLVAGFLRGGAAGREALARHVLSLALRTALAMHPDRELARDVAQEVAILALRDVHRLRDPARLDAWLHTLCVRKVVRSRRAFALRMGREVPLEEDLPADVGPEAAIEAIAARAIQGPLRRLPQRQRAAIILRYVHDLREVDIAEVLGCRPGTAGALLSRGRSALRSDPELQAVARELGLEVDNV